MGVPRFSNLEIPTIYGYLTGNTILTLQTQLFDTVIDITY